MPWSGQSMTPTPWLVQTTDRAPNNPYCLGTFELVTMATRDGSTARARSGSVSSPGKSKYNYGSILAELAVIMCSEAKNPLH